MTRWLTIDADKYLALIREHSTAYRAKAEGIKNAIKTMGEVPMDKAVKVGIDLAYLTAAADTLDRIAEDIETMLSAQEEGG